ncbi:MAG: metallophosphoesterase [Bacillota bacterium]
MRHNGFYIFLAIFLSIYVLLNYYVGRRGWLLFSYWFPWLDRKFYWVVFWLLALAYLIGRLGKRFLPWLDSWGFTMLGSWWMGAFYYLLLSIIIFDLIKFVLGRMGLWPNSLTPILGLGLFLFIVGLLVYGFYNARQPVVRTYAVNINKPGGQLDSLKVVMLSDLHLGRINHKQRLEQAVRQINTIKPDLVLLVGDIIDEDTAPFIEQKMADAFRQLHSRYGVYAVTGNHEYIGGEAERAVAALREAGITVLRDEAVFVANSLYLIGREDQAKERFTGKKRKSLAEIIKNLDRHKPMLLMDHQPRQLEESLMAGIDLQVSGHTHRGQLWPNNYLTSRIYEVDWGYYRKGSLQVVVSSGYGTWGPPFRIGNQPEIVVLQLSFQK